MKALIEQIRKMRSNPQKTISTFGKAECNMSFTWKAAAMQPFIIGGKSKGMSRAFVKPPILLPGERGNYTV